MIYSVEPENCFDGYVDLATGRIDITLGGPAGIRDLPREKLLLAGLLLGKLEENTDLHNLMAAKLLGEYNNTPMMAAMAIGALPKICKLLDLYMSGELVQDS